MATTKVQADNAKIAAAMAAKAEERKAARAAAQRARRAAKVEAAKGAVLEGIAGILSGTATADSVLADPAIQAALADEKAKKARAKKATQAPRPRMVAVDPALLQAVADEKAAAFTVASKSSANPRVLEDPVENAKLIRMRAKWAAERTERRAAKVEERFGEQSPEAISARDDVSQAWAIERTRYAEYREILAASKGAKISESEARVLDGNR